MSTPTLTATQANSVASMIASMVCFMENWNRNGMAIERFARGGTLSTADQTNVTKMVKNITYAYLQSSGANSADFQNIQVQTKNYMSTYGVETCYPPLSN